MLAQVTGSINMRVGIVGLGMIGGCLAWDLRSFGFEVLAVSRQQHTCATALAMNIVDYASVDFSLLATAEIIFICTPIAVIASTVKQLIPHLAPETIITDVGSVKTSVVEECSQLWTNFLGGHPMAGKNDRGIESAQPNLFFDAPYVLTPTETTSPEGLIIMEAIVNKLGSHLYICSPEEHDRAVAWISHLPVMVSASLIAACMQESEAMVLQLAQDLASSGFRDTSRVGAGNVELGMMMAKYNRQELLHCLSQYRSTLDNLIEKIEQENWQELEKILLANQTARNRFI